MEGVEENLPTEVTGDPATDPLKHRQFPNDNILDVAYQFKEKLVVKGSSPPVNGFRENGLSHFLENHHYEEVEETSQNLVEDESARTELNDDATDLSTICVKETNLSLPDSPSADITYVGYESERQMPDIMRLIQKDLSEPYSIYTYRYFIHNWPKLCFLAMHDSKCVGAVVCKLDLHKKTVRRGYIAMLAVDENYRKKKIGTHLVLKAIKAMMADDADEIVLETEITNKPALQLYENLGFVRDKRLFRYYLNGVDALRLKLWLR